MSAKSKGDRCVGGKFNSIGGATEQAANLALVTRLVGEIGSDGWGSIAPKDLCFMEDVRAKLQGTGAAHTKMFGWKQVEAVVRVHKEVRGAS